jgi:hypothetical protein
LNFLPSGWKYPVLLLERWLNQDIITTETFAKSRADSVYVCWSKCGDGYLVYKTKIHCVVIFRFALNINLLKCGRCSFEQCFYKCFFTVKKLKSAEEQWELMKNMRSEELVKQDLFRVAIVDIKSYCKQSRYCAANNALLISSEFGSIITTKRQENFDICCLTLKMKIILWHNLR